MKKTKHDDYFNISGKPGLNNREKFWQISLHFTFNESIHLIAVEQ
jgi:hypothetical protein